MRRFVVIGGVLLGSFLFAAGYLIGRSSSRGPGDHRLEGSEPEASRPRPDAFGDSSRGSADSRWISRSTAAYQRVMEMMTKGELSVNGVGIDSEGMRPGDQVKEFFALSDEEMDLLKGICVERRRVRENHEAKLATVHRCSDEGIEFDLPADPEFAESEAASFVEELKNGFGEEIGGVLGSSVSQAYRGFSVSRKVSYRLLVQDPGIDISEFPVEIRERMASGRTVKTFVNWIEEANTTLKDETGQPFTVSGASTGSIYLSDKDEDAYRPRYHFLWERENDRR